MPNKKCKNCQKEIDSKATKCPYCQSDQRNWFRKHPILTGILALILLILFIPKNSQESKNNSETPATNTGISKQEVVEVATEDDTFPHFKDGTYIIGSDIQAGTYRAKKPTGSCYYARLSGLSGALGEILANENTIYPTVVTISETDKAFKSSGCGTWTQDLSQITESKTTFDDGIYIVKTDIDPGTYKNLGQTGCYYARLSDFSGGLGSILANENTDSQSIVTILATDKGFKSSRCGTWTKVE